MNTTDWCLVLNAAATWYLVGLIWTIQAVHYPLFGKVGPHGFADYQHSHQRRISYIVGPPMFIEALTSVLLLRFSPPAVPSGVLLCGIGLVMLIWISTAFVQVPCHSRLSQGPDPTALARLVRTNWLRTGAWSARGGLVIWMLLQQSSAN